MPQGRQDSNLQPRFWRRADSPAFMRLCGLCGTRCGTVGATVRLGGPSWRSAGSASPRSSPAQPARAPHGHRGRLACARLGTPQGDASQVPSPLDLRGRGTHDRRVESALHVAPGRRRLMRLHRIGGGRARRQARRMATGVDVDVPGLWGYVLRVGSKRTCVA
jgi:hypothetical protein